jgi:hypothetical protein
MNDSASSEKPPAASPLLIPTDSSTFKQLWLRESRTEFPFHEFRLNGIPESLKAFADQFLKEDGTYDDDRLIWTSENSFVRVGEDWNRRHLPGVYGKCRFALRLTSDSHNLPLSIHSTTLENAMSCLELLVGLHDDHFEQMKLCYRGEYEEDEPPIFPLTCRLLQKMMLQNAKRKNVFICMTFTPDQSRTLATSGTGTDIELNQCKFEDDGEAFLEALVARADPQTGLAKLSIVFCHPFAEGILVLFLHLLKCLSLQLSHLESEEACRAVAQAELQYLKLRWCKLGDGGASLVESIREGHGPKGLGLHKSESENGWYPFDSSERFISFLNALRGNSHLERLVVSNFDFHEEGILDALAAALFENEGLVHLALSGRHLDKTCFCKLMRAISAHSSLRTLGLTGIELDMDETEATEEVANMLSVNTQLEEISIDKDDNDSVAWHKLVTPRLEYNIYCKRFPPIQNLRVPSTRAAIMARVLSHVSNRPSPAFMLLRQNSDILSSYSRRVDPQIATSSGKRSRSPSSDAMGVSKLGPGNWT